MDPIRNQQTNTNVDMKCLLLRLIYKIKNLSQNHTNDDIPEIKYLHEFSTYDVILPEINFSPRRIIEYMIDVHECGKRKVEKKSDLLKTVIYKYFHLTSIRQFEFSNNMSLTADLLTICYFYHVIIRKHYTLKVMKDIFDIMINKYNIKNKFEVKLIKEALDERTITAFRIAYAFPSISFPFYAYTPDISTPNYSHDIFKAFPGLSKMLCCPLVPCVMPQLHSRNKVFTLTALLIAVNVKNNQIIIDSKKHPNYPDMPLKVIYERICKLHASTVFPTSLKLELNQKWGFVEMKQGVFKYSDYFLRYRRKALDIILQIKSEDPDLDEIICKVFVDP
ncbi:uncharacterized protein LOC114936457 [Nylanderia fulva]|uniref:uncharacterized protein LOC114936457 n=1 Tax=Nylanderia fulva TaxID=613905 RepID=UPI0010FBB95F|nr:uncharacterized protein LOC114936457 [Nylanderia fulva]